MAIWADATCLASNDSRHDRSGVAFTHNVQKGSALPSRLFKRQREQGFFADGLDWDTLVRCGLMYLVEKEQLDRWAQPQPFRRRIRRQLREVSQRFVQRIPAADEHSALRGGTREKRA